MSRNVGTLQTQLVQSSKVRSVCTRIPGKPTDQLAHHVAQCQVQEPFMRTDQMHGSRPFPLQPPVENLQAILEEYLRSEPPIEGLLEVNKQGHTVTPERQSLWPRIFVAADPMPSYLTVGAQATCVLGGSQAFTQLETNVSFTPKEPSEPGGRSSFLCTITNPDTTHPLVIVLLDNLFHKTLPSLDSLMIARAGSTMPPKALPLGTDPGLLRTHVSTQMPSNSHESLIGIFEEPSTTHKSLYLDDASQDFIRHVSTITAHTHPLITTIRIESDSLNVSLISLPPNLELLSVATPAAHLQFALKLLIEFHWNRFNSFSMDALTRLNLPRLRTTVVNSSHGTYLALAAPLGTVGLPTLKLFHTTALDQAHAPNRDTFLLPIPALKQACADNVLDGRMRPQHLTLRGPLRDTHLSVVLRFLGEKLVSLGLGNPTPSSTSAALRHSGVPLADTIAVCGEHAQSADGTQTYVHDQESTASKSHVMHNGHIEPTFLDVDVASSMDDAGDPAMAARADVPNLSGQISILKRKAVFVGTYSRVYIGMYGTQKVAVKILQRVKNDRVTKRKFRRELFISWRLRHPNIMSLYGYFEYDDGEDVSYALVSKWAEGGSATRYIYRNDLSWNKRLILVCNVAEGLKYLHAFIVHGDLKPLNVLIDEHGVARICDFGLSRIMRGHDGTSLNTTTAHSGTLRYLARELVDTAKGVPTQATDVYALGCLAHEFIYRIPPHAAIDIPFRISKAIYDGIPPARRPMDPEEDVPVLWDLLECCWDTDPSWRPTANQFLEDLEQSLEAVSNALSSIYGDPDVPLEDLDSASLAIEGIFRSL